MCLRGERGLCHAFVIFMSHSFALKARIDTVVYRPLRMAALIRAVHGKGAGTGLKKSVLTVGKGKEGCETKRWTIDKDRMIDRETERERERQRERETERQRERQRQPDSQRKTEREKERER